MKFSRRLRRRRACSARRARDHADEVITHKCLQPADRGRACVCAASSAECPTRSSGRKAQVDGLLRGGGVLVHLVPEKRNCRLRKTSRTRAYRPGNGAAAWSQLGDRVLPCGQRFVTRARRAILLRGLLFLARPGDEPIRHTESSSRGPQCGEREKLSARHLRHHLPSVPGASLETSRRQPGILLRMIVAQVAWRAEAA